MIWSFWSDPVGWVIESMTWMFRDPWWLVAANLLVWPLMFLKWWLEDRWDERRRMRAVRKRQLAADQ